MGNSGDLIEVEARVVKSTSDPERIDFLLAQYKKMDRLARASRSFVVPYDCVGRGDNLSYSMEHLGEYLWRDGSQSVAVLHQALQQLWVSSDRALLDDHHTWRPRITEEIVGDGQFMPDFVRDEIPRPTHGDATLANAMLRFNGEVVLIDPYPAGGKVPSFASVDRAALLQSLCGWEIMLERLPGEPEFLDYCFHDLTDADLRRAMYWLAFKAARISLREKTRAVPRPEILQWCQIVDVQATEIALTGTNRWRP